MTIFDDMKTPNKYDLKFYPADSGEKKPFAIICPGGGYFMVASSVEGEPFAKKLNELGYSAFVLRYRVRKKARQPAPLDDLARAIRHIIDNAAQYGVETNGYSLWGSSAGGHLAGLFASERVCSGTYGLPQPSTVILTYPVITMGEISHRDSVRNFLGSNPTEEEIYAASVENNVNANYPPTFLWNTKTDKTVNPQNCVLMQTALEKFGVDCEFMQFESGEHGAGLGTGTPCEPWFAAAVKFWEKHI